MDSVQILIYRQIKAIQGEDMPVRAAMPVYATDGSCAMDVAAFIPNLRVLTIPDDSIYVIPTGLHFKLPPGYGLKILPRSGLSLKKIRLANAPGLLDSDYTEELGILIHNQTGTPFTIADGMRIAQIAAVRMPRMTLIDVHKRADLGITGRNGGFGSTGEAAVISETRTLDEVIDGQNQNG